MSNEKHFKMYIEIAMHGCMVHTELMARWQQFHVVPAMYVTSKQHCNHFGRSYWEGAV